MKTAHCYICGRERRRGAMVEVFRPLYTLGGKRKTVLACPHHMGVKGMHRAWVEEMKRKKA